MWANYFPNHIMKKQEPTEPILVRIELTLKNPDGTFTTKRLTGEDAKLWNKYVTNLSVLAMARNQNPAFEKLNWKIYTTKKTVV